MPKTLKNRAPIARTADTGKKVLLSSPQIVGVDDQRGKLIGVALDSIVKELAALDAPFITPASIAPRLGITVGAVRYYCRQTKSLRNWSGSYRFMVDDPGHMAALRDVVRLALWSMQHAPKAQVH